jgi:V-type H+-transporting ATPase subunit F
MSSKKKVMKNDNNLIIAIIGDEETVTGFLLAGIGERNEQSKNFFIINKEEKLEIEEIFKTLILRKEVGIILISQHIAEVIRDTLDAYEEIIPTVLEIPSKHLPYSIEKDSLMQKACRQIYGQNIPEDLMK